LLRIAPSETRDAKRFFLVEPSRRWLAPYFRCYSSGNMDGIKLHS